MSPSKKLPKDFYDKDVNVVAKNLLGKIFVHSYNNNFLSGRIVETEAYDGINDEASHSFNGKTKRNEVMFGQAGRLYVYFTYGMHFCANVVTGKDNYGAAVLIRAIEPLDGISILSKNRFGKTALLDKEKTNLCNGPAKLCKAFSISHKDNGTDLQGNKFFILDAPKVDEANIVCSSRIGIKKSIDLLWRYYIKNNTYISKK